jgi:hypothetical protein
MCRQYPPARTLVERTVSEMIPSEEVSRMLVEITTGKEPTLRSPKADALREELRRQCDEITAKGLAVDIPYETAG